MKLALYLPSLRGGGAERVMIQLAAGLAQRGFTVDLVVAQAVGPYLDEIPASVRVHDLKARRVLFSLPALIRYLRRERPHALLSTMGHANVMAVLARAIGRVPVRILLREANTLSQASANARLRRARLLPHLMRWAYRRADGVIAVSKGTADDLIHELRLPSERVQVIYNPTITADLFAKAAAPVEHPWFRDGGAPVIVAIGRLTRQKDFPTLLQALALLRHRRPARLLILGEGEDRPALSRLIDDLGLQGSVDLPGFVKNPYGYLRRADVFVLSSLWEGLPNVLIQALALGTPVVATDCPSGPAEILENGRWGKLVPVGDAGQLARAIEGVLDDRRAPEGLADRLADFAARPVDSYAQLLTAR
jgi:glycosyltransferase involved in cell wall biosynthesis